MWESGAGGNTYRNSASFVITFGFWAIIEKIRIICNINRNFLAKSHCSVNIFYFIQCLKPHAGDLAEHELGRHILFLICSGLLPPQSPAQTSQSLLPNLRLSKVTKSWEFHPLPDLKMSCKNTSVLFSTAPDRLSYGSTLFTSELPTCSPLCYHHGDLLTFSSNKPCLSRILWALNIEIHLLEGPLLLLLRKQLLIFQRSSNVTPSAHPRRQKKVDCGIYHSAWHSSVFISTSLTGLYVTKTKTVPHSF